MPKKTFFNLPEEKKNFIIEKAREEFMQLPYQKLSINRLIKAMQIPTGSFYQYFEDKEDLYLYIVSLYMDAQMEESRLTGEKYNLLDVNQKMVSKDLFQKTRENTPYYREFFVDSFVNTPKSIKRDWTFDHLMGKKYMELYDYSFFDNQDLDPLIREKKELLMGIVLSFTNVIHEFCEEGEVEEWKLYQFCINILKVGMKNFNKGSHKFSFDTIPLPEKNDPFNGKGTL